MERSVYACFSPHSAAVLIAVVALSGCASREYLEIRKAPHNPLAGPLELLSSSGPKPSGRTAALLRKFSLNAQYDSEPAKALASLQAEIDREPTPEKVYAFAELAYVVGHRSNLMGKKEEALNYYSAAVAHAYLYLFDPRFDGQRNSYDPQFRGACDVYNAGLEGTLRIAAAAGQLKPGATHEVVLGERKYTVNITVRGKWHDDDFEHLEFVSDYEVRGLNNRHHSFGLGVPLIAVRKQHEHEEAAEQFYPPGLSFPVTAFLRVSHWDEDGSLACELELHDPLVSNTIKVANQIVPLETDVSTALAFYLDQRELQQTGSLATLGLLNPNKTQQVSGLYMLEPYDPNRIPVIMVHGLWSSPLTWMEMFNDLRSFPEVRENYQFWFYLYPTGQPFWVSAASLRKDLARARHVLDPELRTAPLDQVVLVGHSMGGLVARMQAIGSGDDFWGIVSERPFGDVRADPEEREELARMLFFHPNQSVKRLITIGTPHDGSHFANEYTRWLARHLITLPNLLVQTSQNLVHDNPDVFRNPELLTITTSIDSLAPDSPILPVLKQRETAPWVKHHNIVGHAADDGFLGAFSSGEGDGVVTLASAQFERAESEIVAKASHSAVHQHPKAILEVRRVLMEHLKQYHWEMANRGGQAPRVQFTDRTRPATR